jgi:hypothetical protein
VITSWLTPIVQYRLIAVQGRALAGGALAELREAMTLRAARVARKPDRVFSTSPSDGNQTVGWTRRLRSRQPIKTSA